MAKKILKIIFKILIIPLVYIVQIYAVNSNTFFGINGDLCLMTVVIYTLIEKNSVAYGVAITCGILSDVLFSSVVCKYLVIYLIVVSVLIGLKKIYKQDSKMAIIVFGILSVVIKEALLYIFNIMVAGEFVNIFTLFMNIFKESIINICLGFVIYLSFMCTVKRENK